MADRFRALLDRPLDPSAARAVLALASAILVGFAALLVLSAASKPDPQANTARRPSPIAVPPAAAPAAGPVGDAAERRSPSPRQDPQDIGGSAAARRASRALLSHRALQHVPYRGGDLRIDLVGARGNRAVLRVSSSTVRAARQGWHRFLRRYRDSGRAYVSVFDGQAEGRRTRGGA